MNKTIQRYLIYFCVFICFVQIVECPQVHNLFSKIGIEIDFSPLGQYASLFLSAVLIDVTYRIGIRQTEIQNKQLEIQRHQIDVAEYQLYRKLYRVLRDVKDTPHHLLYRIYSYLEDDFSHEYLPQYWNDEEKKLSKISSEYDECIIDLDLMLGKQHVTPKIYLLKLYACKDIISTMKKLAASNLLKYGIKCDKDYYKLSDNEKIEIITEFIPEKYKKHFKADLNYLLEPIKDNEFIETIENKYRLRKD